MFDRLPHPVEFAVLAVMALGCALMVSLSAKHDAALFFSSVPLFFLSAMLGFRRSRHRAGRSSDESSNSPWQ